MRKIAELIYEGYKRQPIRYRESSKAYDNATTKLLQSLNKEQKQLFLDYELEFIEENTQDKISLIEYIISLLTN